MPGNVKAQFKADYASVVEFGRRAGSKPPPITPIADWVHKKGIGGTYSIKSKRRTGKSGTQEQEDRRAAWFISKKIGKRGIKATPFLYPAFDREVVKLKTRLNGIIR